MSHLRQIKDEIEELFQDFRERYNTEDFDGAIILALTRDGNAVMLTTALNSYEKSYLLHFGQACFQQALINNMDRIE